MEKLNDVIKKKGLVLTPSNWISLNGEYTPLELRMIADLVESNYLRISKGNGNTKRLND